MGVERVSVAIDADLLRRFDRLLERRGLGNRSEAIRDLIRRRLVEEESRRLAGDAVGSLTLVYDHEQRTLSDRLVQRGHHHRARVLSTLHVHLDHSLCLEVQALRGRASDLRHFAEQLIGLKGVKHGQLTMSSARLWRSRKRGAGESSHSHTTPEDTKEQAP